MSGLIILITFSLLPFALTPVIFVACTELNRLEARSLIEATALYRNDHQGEYPDTYFELLDAGYIEREPIAYCASYPERDAVWRAGFRFETENNGDTYLQLPYISAGATVSYDFQQGLWNP